MFSKFSRRPISPLIQYIIGVVVAKSRKYNGYCLVVYSLEKRIFCRIVSSNQGTDRELSEAECTSQNNKPINLLDKVKIPINGVFPLNDEYQKENYVLKPFPKIEILDSIGINELVEKHLAVEINKCEFIFSNNSNKMTINEAKQCNFSFMLAHVSNLTFINLNGKCRCSFYYNGLFYDDFPVTIGKTKDVDLEMFPNGIKYQEALVGFSFGHPFSKSNTEYDAFCYKFLVSFLGILQDDQVIQYTPFGIQNGQESQYNSPASIMNADQKSQNSYSYHSWSRNSKSNFNYTNRSKIQLSQRKSNQSNFSDTKNKDNDFIKNFIDNMFNIQTNILNFINNDDNLEENGKNLIQNINDLIIDKGKYALKSLFYIISKILNSHYQLKNFVVKMEKILLSYKKEIKDHFTNLEIFNIFKSNKRIILFLIKEQILIIDQLIANKITSIKYKDANYIQYFIKEIKPFIYEQLIDDIELLNQEKSQNFETKRDIGQNDKQICKLIQADLIDDFINFIDENKLSLQTKIESSIYETNSFLLKKNPTLIEYSCFYGSIQIFKYLCSNNVTLSQSLLIYAIHGNNMEIINLIEKQLENELEIDFYKKLICESIKCHHNVIADYFIDKIKSKYQENSFTYDDILSSCFHYYNFKYIQDTYDLQSILYYACKYDHYQIVNLIIKNKNININKISEIFIFFNSNSSPLHAAGEKNNIDIINLLFKIEGISINEKCFENCINLTDIVIPY